MKYGSLLLKLDVDTTLNQAGILHNLSVLRTERLFEEVSRVNNRLKLGREHSHCWQILGYGNTQSRIVVFHKPLVRIDTGGGEIGDPPVDGCNFGLGRVQIRLKTSGHDVEAPLF